MSEQPTVRQLEVVARIFDLMGNPSRLHLLALAADGERDVSALAEAAGVNLTTASQHLSKMRLAGLISARREGRRMIYVVDDPHIVTVVRQMFEHIAPDGSLAPDPPIGDPVVLGRPVRSEDHSADDHRLPVRAFRVTRHLLRKLIMLLKGEARSGIAAGERVVIHGRMRP